VPVSIQLAGGLSAAFGFQARNDDPFGDACEPCSSTVYPLSGVPAVVDFFACHTIGRFAALPKGASGTVSGEVPAARLPD
jgi:hypothetical protein